MDGHTERVTSVAFSSDGSRIVSGSFDRSVRVWDASTGQELKVMDGHTERVTSVAFSSDGSRIVSGSFDRSVRVWDASTGQELKVMDGHTERVTSVAFSSDGSRIVSGSCDQTPYIWDNAVQKYIRRKADNFDGYWLLSANHTHPDYLMYVPADARLPDSSNILTIPASAASSVDFTHAALGSEWHKCYSP
ncbi:hypothetical protein H0H93_007778 [Arthromyces matolae]|nr:hypothetical protein H0H93_007778 [Arthromyces matolae]